MTKKVEAGRPGEASRQSCALVEIPRGDAQIARYLRLRVFVHGVQYREHPGKNWDRRRPRWLFEDWCHFPMATKQDFGARRQGNYLSEKKKKQSFFPEAATCVVLTVTFLQQ